MKTKMGDKIKINYEEKRHLDEMEVQFSMYIKLQDMANQYHRGYLVAKNSFWTAVRGRLELPKTARAEVKLDDLNQIIEIIKPSMDKKTNIIRERELSIKLLQLEIERLKLESDKRPA